MAGAVMTDGYRLPAECVIHAVGPNYGVRGDAELLALTYHNVMDLVAEQGVRSIAFPAISVDWASYPKEMATRIAVQTVREWKKAHPDNGMKVIFVCLDMGIYDGFQRALEG